MKGKDLVRIIDTVFSDFEEGMKTLRFNAISKLQNQLRTAYPQDEYSHNLNTDNESGKKIHSA